MCSPVFLYPTRKIHKWLNNRFYQQKYLVCTVRKYAAFHSLLSNMVEENILFCQKKIHNSAGCSLQPIRKQISCQRSPPSPRVPQRFFFFFSQGRHTPTHTHPAEQEAEGWQRGRAVICQPCPRGNIRERLHKTVSAWVEACQLNWA